MPRSAASWSGPAAGRTEQGLDRRTGQRLVEIDPRYFRPLEVDHLQGDASKARREFGWRPQVGFADLVEEMVAADLEQVAREHKTHGQLVREAAE